MSRVAYVSRALANASVSVLGNIINKKEWGFKVADHFSPIILKSFAKNLVHISLEFDGPVSSHEESQMIERITKQCINLRGIEIHN